jgi:bifunctional DNA-binding transcriptional regulator/antitoxin component of YhaV-PrlF toxin-antitoxin module
MGRVTSKPQVTVPKVIATRYRIRPGDELEWTPAGETVRIAKIGAAPSRDERASGRAYGSVTIVNPFSGH